MSELSQRDTAKQIGIGYSTLCRLESGDKPDIESFRKILNWLLSEPEEVIDL
jgi:transcriptional regulator with XRE-family HTH domain